MKEYFIEIFKKNKKEINELYGIRALSCYFVILFHCFAFSLESFPSHYAPYLSNAQNVEFLMSLFFVISSFLVSTSFSRELERASFLESWKNFVIKRSLRIFPAFYVILSVTIIIMAGLLKKSQGMDGVSSFADGLIGLKFKLSFWWTDFAYISNYFPNRILVHGWSLSMEEQFYLAMPIVFLFYTKVLKTRNQKYLFLIFLLLVPNFIRYHYFLNVSMDSFETYVQTLFHPIHTHFEPFVYGILLMELWRAGKVSIELPGAKISFYIVFLLLFSVFCFLCTLEFAEAKQYFVIYRISFYSFFAFVIVFGAVGGFFSKISWFLANPLLVFVGKLSYGIYLVHMLVNTTVMLVVLDHKIPTNNDLGRLLKASLISLVISTFIALLSYLIIEKPFLKIREWTQARFDISTNSFYYVKGNSKERILVSLFLTLLSFFPYIVVKQLIAVDFIPGGLASSFLLSLCLIIPIVMNVISLIVKKKLFFYFYLSRFQD
ncbi:acyltransferase [Leptospira congkakensis]|uniref:Acyltransferase n=1 Tax=Leptospira congkakensis TaxID=2484932 RepID=A0A4Z1AKF8_9LEPT|nr:acyltransferase [Leptospira congkakensis]TGL90258.1 acyltransferase [Leptospira congkakensis]TGL91265.1 acyltransferase [Leptospira congkakensis]TGL98317.1 acyltransferase [Leptospira congkakensis]